MPDLKGRELFEWLHLNKNELRKCKKAKKFSDPCGYAIPFEGIASKAQKALSSNEGAIVVDVVANLTGWMDSDSDVILRGAYNKSISDSGTNMPHITDHRYSILNKVGKTLQVYTLDISPKDLGINSFSSVTPQALVFKTEIRPSAGKIYELYRDGLVTQHSIGLRYVHLELAMNDGDYKDEFASWQKYIGQVINRDKAEAQGYFWVVPEIEVLENSAVLFGANSKTPTLSVDEAKAAADYGTDKHIEPAADKGTAKQKSVTTFLTHL